MSGPTTMVMPSITLLRYYANNHTEPEKQIMLDPIHWKLGSCHDANFVVTSDDKVGIMTTLSFQWLLHHKLSPNTDNHSLQRWKQRLEATGSSPTGNQGVCVNVKVLTEYWTGEAQQDTWPHQLDYLSTHLPVTEYMGWQISFQFYFLPSARRIALSYIWYIH